MADLVPIYDPSARWCWWSLAEVFVGDSSSATQRFVPKILDYVVDPGTFTTYIVSALDPVTLIATLTEIRPANMSFTLSDSDVLFGVGAGTQAQLMRAYLDTRVLPYRLKVDSLLRVGGSMTTYAKIFKGGDVSAATGVVISKIYDSAGNFVSNNVPLETVEIDNHTNYSWKIVKECGCTDTLTDGEVLTIVFYSANGHVVSKSQVLVENTSFIASLNVAVKYITSIALESPFLSESDSSLIEFPLNIPKSAMNLIGVVNYSDGSVVKLPVDGTKFTLLGLDSYLSSIVGQPQDLVLRYVLSASETSYASGGVNGNYVTLPMKMITVNPNNSYTVKLFVYPEWNSSTQGYALRWWMFNLDRNFFQEVTNLIQFSQNTGAFDPQGYGFVQRKQVSLNLKSVSSAFKSFIHTQIVEVTLFGTPDNFETPWLISHESISTRPSFGTGLFAKMLSTTSVNISSGITTLDEWLTRMYKAVFPLTNPSTELVAPTPTHFMLIYGGSSLEYPIADWNTALNMAGTIAVTRTIYVKFFKRTSSGDLNLALSALSISA